MEPSKSLPRFTISIDDARCAHFLWNAFTLAHRHAALAGEVEIPMEYFSRAVEAIGLLHDAVDFQLTEKHWTTVVQDCGYVASEQTIERNAGSVALNMFSSGIG